MRGVTLRVRTAMTLALLAMLRARSVTASAHPLHTTITDLEYRRESRVVRATIRVFQEDFARAAMHVGPDAAPPAAVGDSAASAYVRTHFGLAGPDGRTLPLAWCGVQRSGDLLWVCVETPWAGPAAGVRVLNRMLFDLYGDQVNIVQARYDGSRASLLFTRGDGAKALPRP